MTDELHWLDATELAQRIRERRVSATSALEHYLARVARINPKLNCIIALNETAARERAAAADAALARGEVWGPLHGVPMTLKDTFEVVGMTCTAGAELLRDHRPTRNATVAQHLLNAGAIIFGKTNVPPFAADLQTRNEVFGITRNAWDPDMLAGGSSGGSAVALAAGLTALEVGSDIGGSSRNPAHYNNVFGFRPTWGTISGIGHIPGMPGSLTLDEFGSPGPMARSARDLRLTFDIVRGSDPNFGAIAKPDLPDRHIDTLGSLRVGLWLEDPAAPVARSVRTALDDALLTLRRAGVQRMEVAPPKLDARAAFALYVRMCAGVTGAGIPREEREVMRARLAALEGTVDEHDSGLNRLRGVLMSFADFQRDSQRRGEIRREWAQYFREYDVLVSPVIAVPAIAHGPNFFSRMVDIDGKSVLGFDMLFWAAPQVLGSLPSVVLPAGFTPAGLPVGMQVTTGHLEDYQAIRIAELFSRVLGFADRHPAYPGD